MSKPISFVIPANAGIQGTRQDVALGPRLRGGDGLSVGQ